MSVWSAAQDRKMGMLRGVSLRGTVMVLALLAVLMSEVRFSWTEFLMGRYLAATNSHRPERGNVWEQGRLKQVATQTLEQMVNRQLSARREAQEATSLAQLIEGLPASQGTIISAARFRTLYSQLPEAVARSLFSPILILRLSAEKSWDRVYVERENGTVGIYLLDHGNNVLSYTTLTDHQLQSTSVETTDRSATLDSQPEFAGRIYPASRFFLALDTLPPETKRGVLPAPAALLAVEGTPLRVGISDEVKADMIRIGVEVDTPQGPRVVLTTGQAWAVGQVRMLLEPRAPQPPAGKRRQFGQRGDP
jgi:hypothetical protein